MVSGSEHPLLDPGILRTICGFLGIDAQLALARASRQFFRGVGTACISLIKEHVSSVSASNSRGVEYTKVATEATVQWSLFPVWLCEQVCRAPTRHLSVDLRPFTIREYHLQLLSAVTPVLNGIALPSVSTVHQAVWASFLVRCVELVSFDAVDCPFCSDAMVRAVLAAAGTHLRSFRVHVSSATSPVLLHEDCLSEVAHSGMLDMALCGDGASISSELVANVSLFSKSLQRLDLSATTHVSDRSVISLLPCCPQMAYLNLSASWATTDELVACIWSSCPQLRTLILSGSPLLTPLCAPGELGSSSTFACSGVTHLDLRACPHVDDSVLLTLSTLLPSLSELFLDDCPLLSDRTACAIAENVGSSLQVLHMNNCHRVTNRTVDVLISRCTSLTALQLSGCPNISDAAFESSFSPFPHLRELKLARCSRMTDFGVRMLAQRNLPLEVVDISGCQTITVFSLRSLLQECKSLRMLRIDACPRVDWRIIRDIVLAERLAGHAVGVEGCPSRMDTYLRIVQLPLDRSRRSNTRSEPANAVPSASREFTTGGTPPGTASLVKKPPRPPHPAPAKHWQDVQSKQFV